MKYPQLLFLLLLFTAVMGCAKQTNETSAAPHEDSVGSLRTFTALLQEVNVPAKLVTYADICERQFQDYVSAYSGVLLGNSRVLELMKTETPVDGKTRKKAEDRLAFEEAEFSKQSVLWSQSGCSRLME